MARLHNLPLKYRLSFPFFLLAFLGTFSLVWTAVYSQNELIRRQERERLFSAYRAFRHSIDLHGRWGVSLASNFARNPEIAAALARRDRLRLLELSYSWYLFMKKNYGISQVHFEVDSGRSFLRLHRLYEFGDDLTGYRKTITDALSRRAETFGLERGLTGYGIRGVAPVFFDGKTVGTVEIGFTFGPIFLEEMKKQFDVEASVLLPVENQTRFFTFSTTFPEHFERNNSPYVQVFGSKTIQLLTRQIANTPFVVLVGPIEDYEGNIIGLVELCLDRTGTLGTIRRYLTLMLGIGILGMILSVGAIYIISHLFTRPIAKMVAFAREIALGNQVRQLKVQPSGELGVLANGLNEMLASLDESRRKIRDYADNLEEMVHVRTLALQESEEKYRTMVENVPLVVYRLLGNGKMIFINHSIEEIMGVSAQEVLENEHFWKEKVWEDDRDRVWPLMDQCLNKGEEYKAEYRVRHSGGKLLFVLDHALPSLDEEGHVETVDGFLVDVTDRHQLQRQIIQTEELRTLSEISARLAHEIRNPLVAAGGFARRLLNKLPEGDPYRDVVQIIVHEMGRLEKILEKTLAYLKPFETVLTPSSLNDLICLVLEEQKEKLAEHCVVPETDLSEEVTSVLLDVDLFKKVLESFFQAMVAYCPSGGKLKVRTRPGDNAVYIEIIVEGVQISEDDIEHFFYPFTTRVTETTSLDLPLAKMIIHKHRGLINLVQKKQHQLTLNITLPQ